MTSPIAYHVKKNWIQRYTSISIAMIWCISALLGVLPVFKILPGDVYKVHPTGMTLSVLMDEMMLYEVIMLCSLICVCTLTLLSYCLYQQKAQSRRESLRMGTSATLAAATVGRYHRQDKPQKYDLKTPPSTTVRKNSSCKIEIRFVKKTFRQRNATAAGGVIRNEKSISCSVYQNKFESVAVTQTNPEASIDESNGTRSFPTEEQQYSRHFSPHNSSLCNHSSSDSSSPSKTTRSFPTKTKRVSSVTSLADSDKSLWSSMVAVITAFSFSYAPLVITQMLSKSDKINFEKFPDTFDSNSNYLFNIFMFISTRVVFCNSFVNCIIYNITNKEFLKAARKEKTYWIKSCTP